VHDQRLTRERLADEVGDHHAVALALPRTDRVEEANDDDRQPSASDSPTPVFSPTFQCLAFRGNVLA